MLAAMLLLLAACAEAGPTPDEESRQSTRQASSRKQLLETREDYLRHRLVEVMRTERIDGVRYALWDMTRWHEHYDPCV